ncbi:L,D-transpeptidase family protein [Ilumatobacter nonamiensis]|uniref:L,D-transpeptidase family protein n=1 Tax=Ilumatobacter nonamiensis TaxID=467093 RepID=UPI0011D2674A|nr:L,D-transpeptidase family protein [Ilumatobacter nonamiensis]
MVLDERRKALIGCGVVFGFAALVGCSSAMAGGGGGEGAAAAAAQVTTTTMAPPSTLAPTTTATPTTSTTTTSTTSTTTTTTTTIPDTIQTVAPMDVPIQPIGGNSGGEASRVQQRLLDLGFWVGGVDGDYGLTTSQAVMAFQKYMGFADPSGRVDEQTAQALTVETVRPNARANSGTLVEIDKGKQLLFFVIDGKTEWVLNVSTGNGEEYTEADQNTPGEMISGVSLTPSGLHEVNRERAEGWWEGDLGQIYRPKYFVGGVAVHGSNSIPNYPASHGCVRVSVPAMDWIWDSGIMPLDTSVWVHDGA